MKAHERMRGHRGFTLIELMVGLTIGLLTVLIITEVFAVSNIRNRQIAGGNDAQQAATIINYRIGNILRQAGSNLLFGSNVWGCALQAAKGGEALVPPSSWPAPFADVEKDLRVTPIAVVAADHASTSRESDIVIAMGGSGGTSFIFSGTPDTVDNKITVPNSNGVLLSDYLLMTSTDSAAVGSNCYLLRTSSSSAEFPLTNAGGKLNDTPAFIPLDEDVMPSNLATITAAMGSSGAGLLNLGTTPKFYMLGVDPAERVLTLYDLLQDRNNGTMGSAITLGENVFMLRVLYGVDNNTGTLTWQKPSDSGWQFDDLQAGTQEAANSLRKIKALRFALITRATYPASDLSPDTITLFSSLGTSLQQTIKLTSAEQRYRYQVYETVVPLFNN